MSTLFNPFSLRDVTFRNRIGVSPMCQYSSHEGFADDWHFVHLGAFATGGAGLVMCEATAVTPEGRISPRDLGIWDDAHVEPLRRITAFVSQHGGVPGIQLAHAGRKASARPPWEGGKGLDPSEGGWANMLAPSAIPFSPDYPLPQALSDEGINRIIAAFRDAARRALAAGFRVVELHAAHGYLLHEFLSPLSNERTDAWGGSFENRTRFTREVVRAVREVWPEELPLLVRLSATDWAEGGWAIDDAVQLASVLRTEGVDLIDCSSSGLVPGVRIALGPGYQVPFAERIRREASIPTAAVGLITDPHQAEAIVAEGKADLVMLARELLRNPRWPLAAAHALGAEGAWPVQYQRARLR